MKKPESYRVTKPTQTKETGASLLVDCLIAHKVKYIFGVPGASIMPILDVLADRGPEFVVCRHEQNAAFMAQAWGRLTGQPGVCLATAGPGATNLVTGAATATADRDPIVVLTGQTPLKHLFKIRHQNIDVAQLFTPVTKLSLEVEAASAIPEALAQAFRTALIPRQGAAHLAFPTDVLKSEIKSKPIVRLQSFAGKADHKQLKEALKLLKSGKKPVALIGVGVSEARTTAAVRAFIQTTGIPAVGTFEAAGVVGRQLVNQFIGRVGLTVEEPGDAVLRQADVVIAIGYDVIEYAPSLWPTRAAVIHIDRLPAEVDAEYSPRAELIGDIAENLEQLLLGLGDAHWDMTAEETSARDVMIKEQQRALIRKGATIHPARLVAELRQALRDDDLLISDVGSHQIWLAREFYAFQPRTLLFSMGFQTMGVALPWAIAARLIEPKRRIVACAGDGSFLMSVMELETAVRRKLPFVLLVWRDGTYNLVEIQQLAEYGRVSGTKFGNTDIVLLAKSFGATGFRVTTPQEIVPTLRRAFHVNGPVIIDVPIDYRYNIGLLGKGEIFGG